VSNQAVAEVGQPCWYCGQIAANHFCEHCQRIQPVNSQQDYFSFLGFSRQLNLAASDLEKRFYTLSRQFHPDFFFQSGETEQNYSMECASRLNDAYRTLRDPLKRASYLLQIEGVDAASRKAKIPPDLLSEIFDFNEQLADWRQARKSQTNAAVIAQLRQQIVDFQSLIRQRLQTLQQDLYAQFMAWDQSAATTRQEVLTSINEILAQLTYMMNLANNIAAELED
jgi:molecular chaperone HscB